MSPFAPSTTVKVQSPFAGADSNDESGLIGFHVPENGASLDETVLMLAAALSSKPTWHWLLPAPPLRLNTVAVAPDGEVRVPVRSPAKVWAMPTFLDPISVEHVAPSTEKVMADAYSRPATGMATEAPASSRSGIGTGDPR